MTAPADLTQHFLLENLDIRGQVVRLGPVWQAILARRPYPEELRHLLGEFAALAVLIGSGLKHPGRAVLQVMGHGPVSMAVADCSRELALRSMIKATLAPDPSPKGEGTRNLPLPPGEGWGEGRSLHDLFADGRLALTIENANTARHFQSIVPLEGATLTECFERYFDRSEQVPTHLWIRSTAQSVGALMLQKLPKADEKDAAGWARVQQQAARHAPGLLSFDDAAPLSLGRSVGGEGASAPLSLGRGAGGEGAADPIAAMLTALFPEDDVRLFRPHPVKDGCGRSEEKVVAMLRGLGRAEVEATLAEHGVVKVHDEICNQEYRFAAADVARIFES